MLLLFYYKMYQINNVKKSYNGKLIVDVDALNLQEGDYYAIIGANGSGKSTFAKLIASIIKDDNNKEIHVKNDNNEEVSVGYLAQKPYIFDMSLEKNIGLSYNGHSNTEKKEKINQLIKEFQLEYLKNKNAKKFSGGEQQKVALARFLMKDFDIYIFDESTSAMDPKSVIQAEEIIKKYCANKTIIMITHEIEQSKRFAKRTLVMREGKFG